MNEITKLKQSFKKKEIDKSTFVKQMHLLHRRLFEYAEILKDTDILKIEIVDGQVFMQSKTAGIKLICDDQDERTAPIEILNFDSYEKEEIIMMSSLIYQMGSRQSLIFFDVGTNIGWYSIFFAKNFPQLKVFSFEPIPKTFNYLIKNITLNDLNDKIKAYNFGFSDKNEELIFYYYPEGSVNASAVNLSGLQNVEQLKCQVKKMDDFSSINNIYPDFIKCDVEGAEFFVFKGGLDTLQKSYPVVFSEMLRKWSAKFNYHPNEIIKLFCQIGYECFIVKENKLIKILLVDEETVETNFFFLHVEKHADLIKKFL